MSRGDPGVFAAQLRRLREAAALTQEELAARAGLTAKAVGALERGERRRPYPHTVRALGTALGLDDAGLAALSDAARPAGGDAPAARVPMAAPAPLFGRDDDLREVVALLRSGTARLVTLTGPGGVGKTRLALEVAAAVGGEFPDGTAVVELAALQDVGLVLPTVARQLGLQPAGPDDLVGQLAAFLRDDRRLVVLDNVEHVLDAAPDVAALLARCAGLVVVATSRAPLRVRAEREHALGPLPVPEGSDADAVAASPAAQVLLDRARTVSPSFGRAAGAAPAVAAICRRLDGLPLALELAAAHARYLGPADLLGRLDQALGAARVRDLPARQQTMRATLDWSHDLLTADEQALLRRLAVFAGGFTLDAADAVASGGAEPIDAVAALGGLVEQSLVLSGGGAEPRYRLLEPVRQYAAARLAGSGETDAVRGRHADHVRSVAADARRGMRGPAQAAWLDRLEAEHGNLRAALSALLDGRVRPDPAGAEPDRADPGGPDPDGAAQLLADTWPYWALRGYAGEGTSWAERVLRAGPGAVGRAAAGVALAGLRTATGDIPGARAAAAEAVDGARTHGAGDQLREGLLLLGMARVFLGEPEDAEAVLAEALARSLAAGDGFAVAHSRTAQGQLRLVAGDREGAAALVAEAVGLARDRSGGPFALATALNMEATLSRLAGDDDTALDRLLEAAALAVEMGTLWTLVYTLPALGVQAARRGLPELAAHLFAAGAATSEATSLAVTFPPDRAVNTEQCEAVRASLGEAAFARARDAGRAVRPADVAALIAPLQRRPALQAGPAPR